MKILFEENELEKLEELYKDGTLKHSLIPKNCTGSKFSISFEVLDPVRAERFISFLKYGLDCETINNIGIKVTAFSLFDYTERDKIIQKIRDTLDEIEGVHRD